MGSFCGTPGAQSALFGLGFEPVDLGVCPSRNPFDPPATLKYGFPFRWAPFVAHPYFGVPDFCRVMSSILPVLVGTLKSLRGTGSLFYGKFMDPVRWFRRGICAHKKAFAFWILNFPVSHGKVGDSFSLSTFLNLPATSDMEVASEGVEVSDMTQNEKRQVKNGDEPQTQAQFGMVAHLRRKKGQEDHVDLTAIKKLNKGEMSNLIDELTAMPDVEVVGNGKSKSVQKDLNGHTAKVKPELGGPQAGMAKKMVFSEYPLDFVLANPRDCAEKVRRVKLWLDLCDEIIAKEGGK